MRDRLRPQPIELLAIWLGLLVIAQLQSPYVSVAFGSLVFLWWGLARAWCIQGKERVLIAIAFGFVCLPQPETLALRALWSSSLQLLLLGACGLALWHGTKGLARDATEGSIGLCSAFR